jgi:hypothetical protein
VTLIVDDMCPALTLLARVRVALSQDPAHGTAYASLTTVQAVLDDCRQRLEAMERGPVPRHWRGQHPPTFADLQAGRVVLLAEARQARAVAKALRL